MSCRSNKHIPGLREANLLGAIRGLLFDLEGVFYIGAQPIEGAIEALAQVRRTGLPCRFLTNTSTLSRRNLAAKLTGIGFEIAESEIFSAPWATINYLAESPHSSCHLLVAADLLPEFGDVPQAPLDVADIVVIGDMGVDWSYTLMNRVFRRLLDGARLVAIHKNRFWQASEGLRMDVGGFVAGLEFCSGVQAEVIGKPAQALFRLALADMGLAPSDAVMIGDDIDADIGGAIKVGLRAVLVRTGKFRQVQLDASSIKPHGVIDSVRDLPSLLKQGF